MRDLFSHYMALVEDEMFKGVKKDILNRANRGNAKIFINPNAQEWNEFTSQNNMDVARGVATVNGDIIIVPGKYLPTHDLIINFFKEHMSDLDEVDRPYITRGDYIEIEQIGSGNSTRFRIGETFKRNFDSLPETKKETEKKRISYIINAVKNNTKSGIKFTIVNDL